jgi:hypothetical protein
MPSSPNGYAPAAAASQVPGEVSGGACGGILGYSLLVVSILSLDRNSYAFGDEFSLVLQVKVLITTGAPGRHGTQKSKPSHCSRGMLELYGSKETPGSEVELKSGHFNSHSSIRRNLAR